MVADQRDYWNQFVATVSWDVPKEIVGIVEARHTMEGFSPAKGMPPDVYPVLRIRLDSGRGVIVNGTQARLLELLQLNSPEVGDRIKIAYKGEAPRSAPGLNPTKVFDVKVQRKGSQLPDRPDGTSGKKTTLSENGPGAGN